MKNKEVSRDIHELIVKLHAEEQHERACVATLKCSTAHPSYAIGREKRANYLVSVISNLNSAHSVAMMMTKELGVN